nr:hypothetical protein [Tanacetum cinerariifolium]
EEKDRYNADIRATNILLQGLPKDIYSLINHYTDAKDIWDNVKMLLEGSELTKEDRESQLYDDFEHFRQHKGETIHDYFVRFEKLINDMRNIKMAMSRMQLNSKAHGLISLIICAFFLDQVVQKKPSENIQKGSELGNELTSLAGSELGSKLTFFAEKDRYNADIRATNILLQGFYLWGYLWGKEDRESQLYDDFEHFRQHKGETIHDYFVRFEKLINDMRNIKMAMSRMQLNSKFVNNMLHECGRFVTVVKLNRGLGDSNYDQLYAYLKQHEVYANENKMMLDRFTQHTVDPLALMNQATIQDGKVDFQNVQGRQNRGHENNARGAGGAGYEGAQNRVGYANPDKMLLMQAQENGLTLDEEQLLFIAGGQDNVVDDEVDEQPIQDLALNVDNVFQSDDCDAFDSDVNEAPTAQTMFMANLSSAYPVYDKAGPSYDSDVLSKVHDHDHYQDAICEHHEVHEMHDDVQPNYVVDSHTSYTSDSNMIPYDQHVKDNAVQVVQSDVSAVPNDAYMMILNDMHEPPAQHVYVITQTKVVDKSLTAKLATYKEQVELYQRRARFELTEREQKIDEQLRIVITDHNIKKENLKKTSFCKLQLASTINHNKSMVEEVTSLKKDFKQKENQYLEESLDMKALKEKQVQPALYNSHEIIKTDHVSAIVHNSTDTLKIAKITRKKMNEKMKTPLWTHHKINIRPSDYSKENFLATFTPQTQLTPEQIFWSKDVLKMKTEALNEQAKAAKLVKDLTVYPPNTPVKLVPRVLPTKSQVKINIFALIQLFSKFEKTCKKRITPTGLTERERDESSWIEVSGVSLFALQIRTQSRRTVDVWPPMRDSLEIMLVIAYRFLTPHCARHQVFYPLDVPIICCLCLGYISYVLSTEGTATQILEVVVDEVIKRDNATTSGVRPCDSNASSSSTTQNYPSLSRPLDDTVDVNDDETFRNVSSSSNAVSGVLQTPPA